jgi:hypothetical protein
MNIWLTYGFENHFQWYGSLACVSSIYSTPFSGIVPYHMGQPTSAEGLIVPVHITWPRPYCSSTIWLSQGHLHTVALTIYITCLFGNYFGNAQYGAYYICLGLIFQYKFNGDVCFVIGLPYLIIILGMLNMEHIIYVCKILILI